MPDYKINGIAVPHPPTKVEWGERKDVGVDGNNRNIYSPVRTFNMQWDVLSFKEFKDLHDLWNLVETSGSVAAELPEYTGGDFDTFKTYVSCTITEPKGNMDNKYFTNVQMVIRNITT